MLKELGKGSIIRIVYCTKGAVNREAFGIEVNYEPDGKSFGDR